MFGINICSLAIIRTAVQSMISCFWNVEIRVYSAIFLTMTWVYRSFSHNLVLLINLMFSSPQDGGNSKSAASQPAQAFDYNHGVGSSGSSGGSAAQQKSNITSYESSSYHSSPVTAALKDNMNNTTPSSASKQQQPPPHHNHQQQQQFNQWYEYNQQVSALNSLDPLC